MVANSPGLILSLQVSAFDLWALGVVLQSPAQVTQQTAAALCKEKKPLSDHSDMISGSKNAPKSKFSGIPLGELTALPKSLAGGQLVVSLILPRTKSS